MVDLNRKFGHPCPHPIISLISRAFGWGTLDQLLSLLMFPSKMMPSNLTKNSAIHRAAGPMVPGCSTFLTGTIPKMLHSREWNRSWNGGRVANLQSTVSGHAVSGEHPNRRFHGSVNSAEKFYK